MNNTLRELQLTQLEILIIVDKICHQNHIPYSLYAGTLLGAVRHQGFIPWDDDLDICMLRNDYEHFLKCWKKNPVVGYLLQNKESDPDFTQSFSKIRKDHTTFLQAGEEKYKYHKGVFIDIFPIDRIPTSAPLRMKFQIECMIYQLFTREFSPPSGARLNRSISSLLLKCIDPPTRRVYRKQLEKKITRYAGNLQLQTIAVETQATIKKPLPAHFMSDFTKLLFEGKEFMCTKYWDEYLRLKYGKYMQLPAESERIWKHRPLIIDLERNYEEIQKINA